MMGGADAGGVAHGVGQGVGGWQGGWEAGRMRVVLFELLVLLEVLLEVVVVVGRLRLARIEGRMGRRCVQGHGGGGRAGGTVQRGCEVCAGRGAKEGGGCGGWRTIEAGRWVGDRRQWKGGAGRRRCCWTAHTGGVSYVVVIGDR